MNLTAGAVIGGKYQLIRAVSRGGMGSVWAARHVHLGSVVAVKFMDPSFAGSPAFRARFQREARAAASLQSPHVVGVQDYGIDESTPYIVMELLQGEDLHTRLETLGRITVEETCSLLTQLGKALRRAHEMGLVHRDLKPRNIFLSRADDEEIVKILDFGIAKTMGAELAGESTKTGEIVGSPHFMSPEQFRAEKDLDARSDLWSLGVILFRCLTGKLPFTGDALTLVMVKVMIDPLPLASQVAPDLPPALDGFFLKAFARDRTQRFQSVRALIDAFVASAGTSAVGTVPRDPLESLPWTPPCAPVAPGSTALGGTLTTAELLPARRPPGQRVRVAILAGTGAAMLLGAAGAAFVAVRGARADSQPVVDTLASVGLAPPVIGTVEPSPVVEPAPATSAEAPVVEPATPPAVAPTASKSVARPSVARPATPPAPRARPPDKIPEPVTSSQPENEQDTKTAPTESWGF